MPEGVIICAIICGTILLIAGGIAIFNVISDCGYFALKKTEKAIEAEKMKAKHKELLAGKYI